MGRPSQAVMDFMSKYKIDSDEIWEVHGATWVVKHKALERVAVEVGVKWDRPSVQVCDLTAKIAVVCAFGKLGDHEEWSFGEASPANNKNSYPMAMAEKRARDRVILKLLVSHGALYSESEADEFVQPRQNPRITRAADNAPPDGYLDGGEVVPDEHVITRDDGIQILTMDAQRPIFSELERELLNCPSVEALKRWKVSAKSRASRLSDHWKDDLNKRYLTYLRSLEKSEADEYIERKTG